MRFLFLVCGAMLAACSGETLFGGSGSGGGGSGGAGSGGGGHGGEATTSVSVGGGIMGTLCPPSEPREGDGCMNIGQVCEYGDGPLVYCRPTYMCNFTNGTWDAMFPGCSSHPDQNGCPGSPPMPATGCGMDGQLCLYGAKQCGCTSCPGGPCGPSAVWLCVDPPGNGCPEEAPNYGQPCSPAGLVCNYGACGIGSQAQRVCADGVWVDMQVVCPN